MVKKGARALFPYRKSFSVYFIKKLDKAERACYNINVISK